MPGMGLLPPTYSFADLVAESGLTERQIRTLLAERVVPRADRQGRGARYPKATLDRLKLVRLIRERGPASTSLEQVRDLLDSLTPGEIEGLAEGRIPFRLVDDGDDRGSVGELDARGGVRRRPRPPREELVAAAPLADLPDDDGQEGSGDGDEAEDEHEDADDHEESAGELRALADRPRGGRRAGRGRSRRAAADSPPDPRAAPADRPRPKPASRQLDELVRRLAAVERALSQRGRARVGRVRTSTWHRVAAGRGLEIHARGPLADEQLELLEEAARVLERLIHQPSLGDRRLRVEVPPAEDGD